MINIYFYKKNKMDDFDFDEGSYVSAFRDDKKESWISRNPHTVFSLLFILVIFILFFILIGLPLILNLKPFTFGQN